MRPIINVSLGIVVRIRHLARMSVTSRQLVEKVKMAALDDSLTNFEGQKWSLWAERLGLSSPTSKCDSLNW